LFINILLVLEIKTIAQMADNGCKCANSWAC